MEPQRVQRRLTTIFSTDVQGYSRLMADDETATIRTLTAYKAVLTAHIEAHGGRVVDSPGDNLLAEFGSVVHAVESAVVIQEELKEKNNALIDDRKMRFRIGINVGDVVVEGDRLYGDGVNIAARLESLADGGGICISGDAYRQVRNRLEVGFEDLGEHEVKNIPDPVHAYRVQSEASQKPAPSSGKVSPPPVPDKPSIAVLPFANMSGDPEQEYFSDGITEDLITDLSKISGLFVIARNSSFAYKGKSVDVHHVARELGVRFVLEGSVRRAGQRVRINAQLIDVNTGAHIWADRYDGDMDDIFALQDEINEKIVSALKVSLTASEKADAKSHLTDSVEAYELFLKGRAIFYRFTPETNAECERLLEEAVKIDPDFAAAYAQLTFPYQTGWTFMWPNHENGLDRALEVAEKAVALDENLGLAHSKLGWAQMWYRMHDKVIASFERAIEKSPNDAETYAYFADSLNFLGYPDRAIEMTIKSVQFEPALPPNYAFHWGHSFYLLRRYEEAIEKFRYCIAQAPGFPPARMILAVVFSEMGRLNEAQEEGKELQRLVPGYSLKTVDQIYPYRIEESRNRMLEGLHKAGLPE